MTLKLWNIRSWESVYDLRFSIPTFYDAGCWSSSTPAVKELTSPSLITFHDEVLALLRTCSRKEEEEKKLSFHLSASVRTTIIFLPRPGAFINHQRCQSYCARCRLSVHRSVCLSRPVSSESMKIQLQTDLPKHSLLIIKSWIKENDAQDDKDFIPLTLWWCIQCCYQ